VQAAQPFGKVRDSVDGQGALTHRMPVSTWAQTGWYCCVQISGRGSLHVMRLVAGGGVVAWGGWVVAGALAGAAAAG